MFRLPVYLAVLSLVLFCLPCPAAAPPSGPLPSQIARWVEELGDDSFTVREAATKKLRAVGEPAETLLEKAAAGKDAEVVKRAKSLLADFKWGVYADTPENVVELIHKYQSVARSEKRPIIEKLFAAGSAGCRALVKIARAEADPLVRKDIFADMAATLIRGVPVLLEEGNLAALEGVLQLAVEGDVKTGVRHYAAYHLLTGQLPKRISELEIRAKKNPPGKVEAEVLAYLYRARGDLVKAAKAAADAEMNDVQEGILYESANWKELARQPGLTDTQQWTRYVGLRAAYGRLAGNQKLYESAVKDILDRARPIADGKGDVLPFAKALFLNGRTTDALELLKKAGGEPKLRFEVLSAQLKLKDAFEIVETARKASSPQLPVLEIAQAQVLHRLGEKDKAVAILDRYGKQIKAGPDADWAADLVDAELKIGRTDQAFADAAKLLVIAGTEKDWPTRLFDKLFHDEEDEALALWGMFARLDPKQPAEKTLARLRSLMNGKASVREVDALVADAAKEPAAPVPSRPAEWLAAGEAARRCKQDRQAAECFRKAGSIRALIAWGDLLAAKKQWPQAAVRYLEAYRAGMKTLASEEARERMDDDSLPALALYLHGRALVKAGQPALGKKRIEQAHLLPLGSGEVRYHFARALVRRKQEEDARREQDLLRRLGDPVLAEPGSFYTGEGLEGAAISALMRKDYLKAADGFEQSFLRCISPSIHFTRLTAYVATPAHLHRLRAHGLAAAGKFAEAKTEALRARECIPASIGLVLDLAPLYDRVGKKKDGDELFDAVFAVYESVIKDYPRDAMSHNQAAWMAACCRRRLDKGLLYARKAVALSPSTAAYHDTLGEVLFQSGKKDEAVAEGKKAIALEPERAYFRKQLKRLEAGNPQAPRPEGEEDE